MTKKKLLLTKKEYAEMLQAKTQASIKNNGHGYINWAEIWNKYEEQASYKWGGWYFGKEHLTLDLLDTPEGNYPHENPFYQVDLETINSSAKMLDWIFQVNGKVSKMYGFDVCQNLINAFDDIFKPQKNCCSYGADKKFDGSKIAKEYRNILMNQKLELGDRL
jgi:hypothetical protein|tara:strand:+ start:12 stop:500 length:489 start_codon:yes stop_codon:yes gene_type:complete